MNMCGWGSYYREKNTEEAGLIRVHECRIDKDVKSVNNVMDLTNQ